MYSVQILEMPDGVRDGFSKLCDDLSPEQFNPYTNHRESSALTACLLAELLAPYAETRTQLKKLGNEGFGAVIIKNLPFDEQVPYTPTKLNDFGTNGKGFVSEWIHSALVSLMGFETLTNPNIKNAMPIHNIVPKEGAEKKVSNAGILPFGYHTERAYAGLETPDYLSLFALRNNDNVKTNLVFMDEFFEKAQLNKEENDLLVLPAFKFKTGDAYDTEQMDEYVGPVVTFDKRGNKTYRFTSVSAKISGVTEQAQKLVDKLASLIENDDSLNKGVVIPEGACLMFNNKQVVHGRGAIGSNPKTIYTPCNRYQGDPDGRWLQRIYSRKKNNK